MVVPNHPSLNHHQCPTCRYGPHGVCPQISCKECPRWKLRGESLGYACECSYYEQTGENCPHYEECNFEEYEEDE